MEFVHGDTLDTVLRSHGTLNAGEAALVGQDVCRALAAVHLAGFVHRDVKPRNIMRDRTGRIVLMDFGTGQDIVDPTGEGRMNIAGTPPYMAPEVLAGQPATVASDVYSVGVLLYHLVTSAYPVEGRTIDEITAAHLQGRRTPLGQRRPDLPLPFMGIVERAIAVRPEERWPSAATLREALGQVDGETGIDWRQIAVRLAAGLGLVAGAGGALIGLGAINSKYYNSFVLGREGFVRESLWDWMYFGALSLTAPLVLLMLALLGLSLLLVLWQLLINVSDTGRRLDAFAARAAGRLKLDDASVASNWALLASAGVFVAAWWANLPMLSKLTELFPDISTAPVEQLAFLAPDHFFEREDYRVWFTWSTILGAAVWVPVFRLAARQGKTVSPLMLLAGAVVVALSSALLDLPYRAFSQSELETATWQGERCYVLGERAEDVLVFCPELAPPRSHVVDRGATSLQRLGVKENVFARIRSAK